MTDRNLRLQPMVHVEDMAASLSFYEALGASVRQGSRDGDFVVVDIGGAELGFLAHPPNPQQNEGTVELNFECTSAVADLEDDLRALGVTITQPTTDEGFGRQLQVTSPDGLLIKINELDPQAFGPGDPLT